MLIYRTLRRVTIALRSVQVAAQRLANRAALIAKRMGYMAQAVGLATLEHNECKSKDRVIAARMDTERALDRMLTREERLEDQFHDLCYRNAETRRNILTEVL